MKLVARVAKITLAGAAMVLFSAAKYLGRSVLGSHYWTLKSSLQHSAIRTGLWKIPQGVKLHLGCGSKRLDGFLNIDLMSGLADLLSDCARLPFLRSGIASHIVTEHMLEHLSRKEALLAIREWTRLLAPGGILEVEVPDLIWCLENFLAGTEADRYQLLYERSGSVATIYGHQSNLGQFHKFGYTPEHLATCISECGLEVVETKLYMTPHPCRSIRIRAKKA